jgi:hypothetical protein
MHLADEFPDHTRYKSEHARFMNGTASSCFTVRLSGFMGSRTVAVAIGESRYREITTPIIALIITGWLGCLAAALIYLLGWWLGPVSVLSVIAAVILWGITARIAVGRLRRSVLDNPEFYAFGLRSGLMTLRGRGYFDLAG